MSDQFLSVTPDTYKARFVGTIELDPSEAGKYDQEVMAVVVFRVGGASLDENAAGSMVQTNKFKIKDFAIVKDEGLKKEIYESVAGLDEPPLTLPFDVPKSGRIVVSADAEVDTPDEEEVDVEAFSSAPPAVGHSATRDPALAAFLREA